jgi:hypothetical protein
VPRVAQTSQCIGATGATPSIRRGAWSSHDESGYRACDETQS